MPLFSHAHRGANLGNDLLEPLLRSDISTRYIEHKHFLLAKIKLALECFKTTYNYERVVEIYRELFVWMPICLGKTHSETIKGLVEYAFTLGAHSYDSGTSISSTLPSLRRSTRGTCNMLVYASSGRSIARLRYSSTNQSWNTARRSKPNSPRKHCRLAACALPGCTLRARRRLPKLSVCDTL
jgi:hypothetical protein